MVRTVKTARTTKTPARASSRIKADLQEELDEIQTEVAEHAPPDLKMAEMVRLREAEMRSSVEGISVERVVQKVSGLGLEISRALSQVSEQLIDQVNELERVREVLALEKAELERMHKIDVTATSIDSLVAEYQGRKKQLEAEEVAAHSAWAAEKQAAEQAHKEQVATLHKQRQREAEEYDYKLALDRKKAQDEFEERVRSQERQNRERQEQFDKSWQQREAALKEREAELLNLRQEVELFPSRLKKEVESAVAQAVGAAKQAHETKVTLLTKDTEADKRVAALQIKGLEETGAKQAAQISDLQQQLAAAKQQVQDIAVKALESAAGAKTLEEVRQIAREQAKGRDK